MKLIRFFLHWSIERYVQLGLAILAGIYAINTKDYSILIVTVWLGLLALLNVSCCGTKGCRSDLPSKEEKSNEKEISVTFEEIKDGNKKL